MAVPRQYHAVLIAIVRVGTVTAAGAVVAAIDSYIARAKGAYCTYMCYHPGRGVDWE